MIKKQRGFFAIIAVILIVIIGFLGIAVAYMLSGSAASSLHFQQSSRALYIAEGGIEETVRYLLTPNLSGSAARIACSSVTGNSNLTTISLGSGVYTVTNTSSSYSNPATTLNGALSSSNTVIPVSSTASYASSGRIMIDQELINYAAVSSNSSDCGGTAPCFIGAERGVDNTIANAHATGTRVGQNQCTIQSQGGIPNLTSPTYQRTLQNNVQIQEGWAVGQNDGNAVIARWNGSTTWSRFTPSPALANQQLNDVYMLSYADGWAVGNSKTFVFWNGTQWTAGNTTGNPPNQNYNGIACVDTNHCWAVGASKAFAQWNGTTWSTSSTTGNPPNHNYNSISCLTTANCWAVGDAKSFAQWNGTTWSTGDTTGAPPNQNYFGVSCIDSSHCFAVGASRAFAAWNGTTWSTSPQGTPTPTNAQYNYVSCTDSSHCWAVGNSTAFAQWDGTSWKASTLSGTNAPVSANYNSVNCSKTNDCWAVGNAASGNATLAHWDGTSWQKITPPNGVFTKNLLSIFIISPNSQPKSEWQEIFP